MLRHLLALLGALLLPQDLAGGILLRRVQDPAPGPETAPAASQAPLEGPDEPSAAFPVRGSLIARYLYRDATGDRRDQDLLLYLALDAGDARRDGVTASFYGRAIRDLEGDGAGLAGRSLSSLQDSAFRTTDWKLYRAWVAVHGLPAEGSLRLGRQNLYETPLWLNFDGGRLDLHPLVFGQPFTFQAYGGLPAHFYEASTGGDWLAGLAAATSPWRGGHVRLDALRLEDRRFFGKPGNDLIGVRISHASPSGLFGSLAWSHLDGRTRDVSLQTTWNDPGTRLLVTALARILFSRQSAESLEFDPFTLILLPEEPFQEGQILVSKAFFERPGLRVDLGAYARRLRNGTRESEFNRQFERYWAGLTLEDFPLRGASLGAAATSWDSGRDRITSVSAELSGRAHGYEVTLGSGYSLFRYDFFQGIERSRVRDLHGRLRVPVGGFASLVLDLRFEKDSLEKYFLGSLQVEVFF